MALRRLGLAVERDSSGSAFGKQFKRAERSGAPWAAVIGDDEVASGQVRLKPLMPQGDQASGAGEHLLPLDQPAALLAAVRPAA